MKIGVDLDNTIICYDDAFSAAARQRGLIQTGAIVDKHEVRSLARNLPDGENVWRSLQGQVYGRLIWKARLFSGVLRVLWRCRARGFSVSIVSHKTKFGHFDNSAVSLRDAAIVFLRENGLYPGESLAPVDMVSFFDTQEEKIAHINIQKFDWFVDDLPEILESPSISKETRKIGFCPDGSQQFREAKSVASWGEIESLILGAWTQDELHQLVSTISSRKPREISWIGGRGNSQVAKVTCSQGTNAALKIYAQDESHDRYFSEQKAFEILAECGEGRVPKSFGGSRELGVGLISWVDGQAIGYPNVDDIEGALEFLAVLHNLRNDSRFRNLPPASAAITSGLGLQIQVERRLSTLRSKAIDSPALLAFVEREFMPALNEITSWTRHNWPDREFDANLPIKELTLSPSDFGFHNCLKLSDGTLMFLDFEYFGWDDPVKLCADFLIHPAMELSGNLKRRWVEGVTPIYGERARARLQVAFGLIGLAWCLILLNSFRRDLRVTRKLVDPALGVDNPVYLDEKLSSARRLLSRVKSTYVCFDNFLEEELESG